MFLILGVPGIADPHEMIHGHMDESIPITNDEDDQDNHKYGNTDFRLLIKLDFFICFPPLFSNKLS